jgi:hypothetical protein
VESGLIPRAIDYLRKPGKYLYLREVVRGSHDFLGYNCDDLAIPNPKRVVAGEVDFGVEMKSKVMVL